MPHQRPFDFVLKITKKQQSGSIEQIKYFFEKSDNISLWIIGLSVASIGLISTNFKEVSESIGIYSVKAMIILLSLSILLGIVYRIIYLYLLTIVIRIEYQLNVAFTDEVTMDTESTLEENDSIEMLLKKIRDGLGEDLSYELHNYDLLTIEQKEAKFNRLKKYYLDSIAFAKQDLTDAFKTINTAYATAYGYSVEEYNRKVDINVGKRYRSLAVILLFLYYSFIIAFLSALCIYAFSIVW